MDVTSGVARRIDHLGRIVVPVLKPFWNVPLPLLMNTLIVPSPLPVAKSGLPSRL